MVNYRSKRVYFSPLSSTKIFYVSHRVLQDETYNQKKYYNDVHLLGNVGSGGHASQMVYDTEANVLFNTQYLGTPQLVVGPRENHMKV